MVYPISFATKKIKSFIFKISTHKRTRMEKGTQFWTNLLAFPWMASHNPIGYCFSAIYVLLLAAMKYLRHWHPNQQFKMELLSPSLSLYKFESLKSNKTFQSRFGIFSPSFWAIQQAKHPLNTSHWINRGVECWPNKKWTRFRKNSQNKLTNENSCAQRHQIVFIFFNFSGRFRLKR